LGSVGDSFPPGTRENRITRPPRPTRLLPQVRSRVV